MQENIVDIKIDHLKPRMKTLPSFKALKIVPGETIVQAKGKPFKLSIKANHDELLETRRV